MTSRTAILLYHRVAEVGRDPHRLCVAPDRFSAQLKHLRRHVELVPLEAVLRWSRRPRVAITFDDGYADNATTAAPILEALEFPATFFVVAGDTRSRGFWWDRLERLMLDREPLVDALVLVVDDRPLSIDVRTQTARVRAHETVYRRLRRLPDERIELTIAEIGHQYKACDSAAPALLDDAQIRALSAHPLFAVGAHTLEHPYLPSLSSSSQLDETAGARRLLERITQRPVTAFSYPHGGYDAHALSAVKRSGYRLACSSDPGRVPPWSPRLRLPRNVVLDWSEDEFVRRTGALFGT